VHGVGVVHRIGVVHGVGVVDRVGVERPQRDQVIQPDPLHRRDAETCPCLLQQDPAVGRQRGALVLDLELDPHDAELAAVLRELALGVRGVQVPAELLGDFVELPDLRADVAASGDGQPRPDVHGRPRCDALDGQRGAGVEDASVDLSEDMGRWDGRLPPGREG